LDNIAINQNTIISAYNDLDVAGTSQAVTGLTPNTTYYYRVRAIGGGASANSNVISTTLSKGTPTLSVSGTQIFNYNGSPQGPATISYNGDGGTPTLLYTNTSGTAYSSATAPTNIGDYQVVASAAAGTNYNAATSAPYTFTINPKITPTISISGATSFNFSGTAQGPATITYNGNGRTSRIYTSTDGAGYYSGIAPINVGAYQVVASALETASYNAVTSAAFTFVIVEKQGITTSISNLTGFSYVGAGPSAEKSVVVSGLYLQGNITVTAPTNYEISTGTGGSFAATSSITLTPILGTVSATTIYVRLKSGLLAGPYYSQNIRLESTGAIMKSVVCRGAVTSVTPPVTTNKPLSDLNPSATTDVTVNAGTLSVTGNATVNNITVEPGSKLAFTTASTLTVEGDLTFNAASISSTTSSFSSNLGGGTINVTGTVSYVRRMDDTRWYFMAFPFPVEVANIRNVATGIPMGSNLIIKYYDGARRANGNIGLNWMEVTNSNHPTGLLIANQGYIFGISSGAFDVRFPLPNAISEGVEATVPVLENIGSGSNNHYGWNLISQPYISIFSGINIAGINQMSIPDAGTGNATYNQVAKSAATINPFDAYFVQVGATGNLSFALAGRQAAPSTVSKNTSEEIQLSFASKTGTDKTYLTLDNANTTAYEIGYDLEKMIGTGTDRPQVYTVLNGVNYAFNALPMSSVVNLPVGVYTKTAGVTTISIDATLAPSLSQLLLTDTKAIPVTVTDLLTSNYSYTATAGTDNTRFKITAQRVPTGIETVNEGENNGATIKIVNGKMLLDNLKAQTTVRVYDAIGRLVANKTTYNNSLEVPLSSVGMYTIQLQSGAKSWTKKMVYNR
jgi:hypothetical protein